MTARLTSHLSKEAAAYVDEVLAPILATRGGPDDRAGGGGGGRPVPPRAGTEAEQAGKAAWDVRIQHPGVGDVGRHLLAGRLRGHRVDLTKFGDLLADIARRLGEAGDPDSLGQRRAKAIGIVADVHAGADLDDLITTLVAL